MAQIMYQKKITLKEAFGDESTFNNYLRDNRNIFMSELGLEFSELNREVPVGSFSSDLVGKCTNSKVVVIESQFGESNHDHLGKILTYMVGLQAGDIILICETARPEHKAIADWVNELLGKKGTFHILEAGVHRDSLNPISLSFSEVTEKKLSKKEKTSSYHKPEGSIWKEFWSEFKTYALEKGYKELNSPNPMNSGWGFSWSSGIKGTSYNLCATPNKVYSELWAGPTSKEVVRDLLRTTGTRLGLRVTGGPKTSGLRKETALELRLKEKEDWKGAWEGLLDSYVVLRDSTRSLIEELKTLDRT